MIIKKITMGFVCQTFDTEKNAFISQEFVASDNVTWDDKVSFPVKDEVSFPVPHKIAEPYLGFNMVQPITPGEHIFNPDTGR